MKTINLSFIGLSLILLSCSKSGNNTVETLNDTIPSFSGKIGDDLVNIYHTYDGGDTSTGMYLEAKSVFVPSRDVKFWRFTFYPNSISYISIDFFPNTLKTIPVGTDSIDQVQGHYFTLSKTHELYDLGEGVIKITKSDNGKIDGSIDLTIIEQEDHSKKKRMYGTFKNVKYFNNGLE